MLPIPAIFLGAKGAVLGAKGIAVAGHAAAPHVVIAAHAAAPHVLGLTHGLHQQALEAGLHAHVVDALAALHAKTGLVAQHIASRAGEIGITKAATVHTGASVARPDVLTRAIAVAPVGVATATGVKAAAPSVAPAVRRMAEKTAAKTAVKETVKLLKNARKPTDRTAEGPGTH